MSWITPSATRNYLLKDPLCDWLDKFAGNLTKEISSPEIGNLVTSISTAGKSSDKFLSFILNQGNNFEKGVIDLLKKKFKIKLVDISQWDPSRNVERSMDTRFIQTVNAMKKGTPLIYQGVLIDTDEHIRGIPDLIVRSDYLSQLVSMKYLEAMEEKKSCELTKKNYHYRIVDIKFTTLALRSTGINLLNSGSVPAFKSQVCLYNKLLGKVQGYTPDQAYILGRRWKLTKSDQVDQGFTCFERLGVVDFSAFDKPIIEKTEKAVNWLRLLEKEGHTWKVMTLPLPHEELYPNMSNNHDAPWRPIKEIIAKQIKEITSLWMCGPKNRTLAHQAGILQWTDPKCTSESLGVKGQKTSKILTEILETNKGPHIFNIRPRIIDLEYKNWQSNDGILELYIDFETINDIFNDFHELPRQKSFNYIIMLGVYYLDLERGSENPEGMTGGMKYKSFVANQIASAEELRICQEFSAFVLEMAQKQKRKNVRLVHWSNAEVLSWEKASERNKLHDIDTFCMNNNQGITVDFFDLLDFFKTVPITIKGCLNFGLKTVAKRMFELGCIKSTWPGNLLCTDGVSAMLQTYNAYKECHLSGMGLLEHPLIKDELAYNQVDCKVLHEILIYLRQKHSNCDPEILPDSLHEDSQETEKITDSDETECNQGYNLRSRQNKKRKASKVSKYNRQDQINDRIHNQLAKETESQESQESQEDYFETDFSPLAKRLRKESGNLKDQDIEEILCDLEDILTTEYLGSKPADRSWKIGLDDVEINGIEPELKKIRKLISDDWPTIQKIIQAKISNENKRLALELFDIWNNMEPYTEDHLNMKNRIMKIIAETINDQEERLKLILKDYSLQVNVKMKICNLNADDLTKAKLYQMYDTMLQYKSDSTEYMTLQRKLDVALQLPYRNIKKLEYQDRSEFLSSVYQKLDTEIYEMKDIKDELIACLNSRLLNVKSKAMLGLKGLAGTGKSRLVEVFANAVGLPFQRINLGGSEDPSVFKGNNTVWTGSSPSIILQTLIGLQCSNGIVFFDEIDKLGSSDKGLLVQYALLHVTDYTQNHQWTDDFIPEISHDLSGLWFIFAMNLDELLNKTLKDRLHIVVVPSYSVESIYIISRDYVVPRILQDQGMQKGDIILTEDGFQTLNSICNCVQSEGVRSIERACRTLISRLQLLFSVKGGPLYDKLSFSLSRKPTLPIKITGSMVKRLLSQLEILS